MDINQLNRDFGLLKQLQFVSGVNDMPLLIVNNGSASAQISLYGAQVLSYRPHNATEDLLFLSKQSEFTKGKAIRGGIPICWPWFGPDPKGLQRPNHGFVRNHYWQVLQTEAISASETKISLVFNERFKQENTWQQPFRLQLDITVGETLGLSLTTCNTGEKVFSITQAYHSYFNVGNVKRIQVSGLEASDYYDKLAQGAQKTQQGAVTVNAEIDRIYSNADHDLTINDPVLKRQIQIFSPSTSTAVVWNPWSKTSRKMTDLANTAYKAFVCVEVGNIAFDLIQVYPGKQHSFRAWFKIVPL